MNGQDVIVTNPARPESAALLAQVFYADPAGHVDHQPAHVRVIEPGITAILKLAAGNYLVIQHLPAENRRHIANGDDYS